MKPTRTTDLDQPTILSAIVESAGMSEWRDDPLTGRRVRIAEARAERPRDFTSPASPKAPGAPEAACPFCAGNEASTPQEIDSVSDGKEAWLCRVVPNRYPAFAGTSGVQEVFIESPEHKKRFVDLSPAEATAAVTAWLRRLAFWQQEGRFDYVVLFKNEGVAAGVSRSHVHSQLVALPETPPIVRDEWLRSTGRLPVPKDRLIAEEEGYTLFCPPAPRFAGESWLMPPLEWGSIAPLIESPDKTNRLAVLLQRLIAAVTSVAGEEAYNLIFQIPPLSAPKEPGYQWRIEIIPRNAIHAGFELATGLGINPLSPEAAAEQLRGVWGRSEQRAERASG